MKKVVLGAILLFSTVGFSQTVCKTVDEFNHQVSYLADKDVIVIDNNKTSKITIQPFMKEYEGKVIFAELIVLVKGINCVEKDSELEILFDNGETAVFNNWKKFNCDGVNYMSLTVKGHKLFLENKMVKMRYTNKSDYKSISGNVNPLQSNYFKTLFTNIDLGNLNGFKTCSK